MIPLSDVIPSRTTPWTTLTLIAVNAVVLAVELSLPHDRLREIIYACGVIPEAIAPLPIVTALFLHPGLIHALSNLGALWLFGDNVEDRLGHGRFLVFYLLTGAAGMAAEALAQPDSPFPVIGAAAPVAGVIAAHFVLFPRSRSLILIPVPWALDIVEVPSLLLAACWFLLQAIGADGNLTRAIVIAGPPLFAQVGGALSGVMAVWLLRRPERAGIDWWSGRGA